MGLNNIKIKQLNRNQVFRCLLETGEMSKRGAADALQLSIPTITQCLNELLKMGLVRECGLMESIGGRKSMGYQVVSDAKVAIGVDITRNHINLVVTDMTLQPKCLKRVGIRLSDTEQSYQELAEIILGFLTENHIDQTLILGIGISLPAIIGKDGKYIVSLHEGMEISNGLYGYIKERFSLPVLMENDANSAGQAELRARRSEKDTVYFFLSTSVGGTIVIDGKPVYGKNRRSGEFGHMTLIPDGRKCYCGRKGCIDAYCSTELLSELTGGKLELFFDRLEEGNQKCNLVWEEYLDHIALAIHNLNSAFDMDIIIGGYLGQFIKPYMKQLEKRILKYDPYLQDIQFVKPAELKYEAAAMGVAGVFIDEFIQGI